MVLNETVTVMTLGGVRGRLKLVDLIGRQCAAFAVHEILDKAVPWVAAAQVIADPKDVAAVEVDARNVQCRPRDTARTQGHCVARALDVDVGPGVAGKVAAAGDQSAFNPRVAVGEVETSASGKVPVH